MECAICECFEFGYGRTPCCYEWVCDEHSKSFPMCSIESCDMYYLDMCKPCVEINSWICQECDFTLCHNCQHREHNCTSK